MKTLEIDKVAGDDASMVDKSSLAARGEEMKKDNLMPASATDDTVKTSRSADKKARRLKV